MLKEVMPDIMEKGTVRWKQSVLCKADFIHSFSRWEKFN